MKLLGRENIYLLVAMTLASTGVFSYFPYVTTALGKYIGLRDFDSTNVVALGILSGNALAYAISLSIPGGRILKYLKVGYVTAIGSLLLVLLPENTQLMALVIFAASIAAFRFSVGITGNVARALQIQYLPAQAGKGLLISYIKLSSSIGGVLGPMLGSYVISAGGFSDLVFMSAGLFALSLSFAVFLRSPERQSAAPAGKSAQIWRALRTQPSVVYAISISAMIHFLFEAQIYSTMSLNIERHNVGYLDLIGVLFSANAIFLAVLVVPVMSFVNKLENRHWTVLLGSFMSVLGIVGSMFVKSTTSAVLDALLFTAGEIITPQVMLDMITDLNEKEGSLAAIATFNFFTGAIGISLGVWFGGLMSGRSIGANIIAWISLYVVFAISFAFCRKRHVIALQGVGGNAYAGT
jgi:predicted MFS family arabinose efflux permease